ncbi:hypothetical protein [Thioalkalivibrio sp. ALMg9]|uniref:hypothetical protein n=1 Tax=Thioalkalivibrio sp. ALMg9 TaxID=1266912 RepID=UPI00035F49E3|nr:hypothetical protein [Thioalkalivibrio sp. ALMg9]
MPIKTRRFAPKQTEALTPRGPASQYLTKNRGRPSDTKPTPAAVQRVRSLKARTVARRSILNRLAPDVRAEDIDTAESWLNLEEVGVVLGMDEKQVAARHARGEPPKFEMRRNDQGQTELLCSLEALSMYLIDQATR